MRRTALGAALLAVAACLPFEQRVETYCERVAAPFCPREDAGGGSDAGPEGVDAGLDGGVDGGTPPSGRQVRVFRSLAHLLADGGLVTGDGPALPPDQVELWVDSDGGTLHLGPSRVDADGGLVFEGVPSGPYWLVVPESLYTALSTQLRFVETDSDWVDLGTVVHGRPDSRIVRYSTPLELNLDLPDPWTHSGQWATRLVVVSRSLGFTSAIRSSQLNPAPAEGALSVGAVAEYSTLISSRTDERMPLFEGDDLHLLQLGPLDGGTYAMGAVASASLPAFAMAEVDGGTVSASLTRLPRQVARMWRSKSDFSDKLRALAHPRAYLVWYMFQISAYPGDGQYRWRNSPALAAGFAEDATDLIYFGNPFPAEWRLTKAINVFYRVPYTAPQASTGTVLACSVDYADDDVFSFAYARFLPPSELRINGADAWAPQADAGTAPELTWTQPNGTNPSYVIELIELYESGGQSQVSWGGVFYTRRPSIRFPPGVLQPGKTYLARITARTRTPDDWESFPNRPLSSPRDSACAMTEPFSP